LANPAQEFQNYVIVDKEDGVDPEAIASERFGRILYHGTTQCTDVMDRCRKHEEKFKNKLTGVIVTIKWNNEKAKRFGFEDAEQACVATEIIFSSWQKSYAFRQDPGYRLKKHNGEALKKAEEIKWFRQFLFMRLNHSLQDKNII